MANAEVTARAARVHRSRRSKYNENNIVDDGSCFYCPMEVPAIAKPSCRWPTHSPPAKWHDGRQRVRLRCCRTVFLEFETPCMTDHKPATVIIEVPDGMEIRL